MPASEFILKFAKDGATAVVRIDVTIDKSDPKKETPAERARDLANLIGGMTFGAIPRLFEKEARIASYNPASVPASAAKMKRPRTGR